MYLAVLGLAVLDQVYCFAGDVSAAAAVVEEAVAAAEEVKSFPGQRMQE